jgi:hypothetical protein
LPGDSVTLPQAPLAPTTPHSSILPHEDLSVQAPCYQTKPDSFGRYRTYPTRPTLNPDENSSLTSHVDAPTLEQELPCATSRVGSLYPAGEITRENLFSAFSNPTAGLLMCWQYSGSTTKSTAELQRLWTFVKDPAFDPAVESTFSHERERKNILRYLSEEGNPFRAEHGWKKSKARIPLFKEDTTYLSENDPNIPSLSVDIHHRLLIDVIKSVLADDISKTFHFTPFEEYWTSADGRKLRVYSEAYTSPEMLKAHADINALPRDVGDTYERVVMPLMIWSDATHLANFGDASLWPIYLFFGNQSKYVRGKPTSGACHHVAYIPKVPLVTL